MVKSYLSYKQRASFGVICSPASNAIFDSTQTLAISSCLDQVIVWNLATNELLHRWIDPDCQAEVTLIDHSYASVDEYAVGYGDGSIRIWTLSGDLKMTLRGHTSPICTLAWNSSSLLLASGSRDGDIVIWDISAESGRSRLKGHRAATTKLFFLTDTILLSSGRDSFIKAWDVSIQHCFQTLVEEHPVGSFTIIPQHNILITGSADSFFRLFKISEDFSFISTTSTLLTFIDKIERSLPGKERIVSMDVSNSLLYVHSFDKSVELYRILDQEALDKKTIRRKKRNPGKENVISVSDTFQFISALRSSHKIRSVCLGRNIGKNSEMKILVSLFSNTLQLWKLCKNQSSDQGKISLDLLHSLEHHGHRSSIGWVSYSNGMLATGSSDSIKLWDSMTGKAIGTLFTRDLFDDSPSCGAFISKDWLVAGTRSGFLLLINTTTSEITEKYSHSTPGFISSVKIQNDLLVSSTTSTIQLWTIGITNESNKPSLVQTGQNNGLLQEANDSIVSMAISSDTKFLAVSLLDCTVKIYYRDSLKFFLSLYGHKLPVHAMDFTTDSHLIATASADKNIKIWGLDFGDCHKSIFAHSEPLTSIVWIPKTHLFFSSSKDKTIKYWDGDTFEHITTIKGHHSEISSLAISPEGKFLFSTGGSDRSCRIWYRSDEQIFVEDQRDKEADERLASELINEDLGTISGDALSKLTLEGSMDPDAEGEVFLPSTVKSLQSIKSSERLYEVITLVATENLELKVLKESNSPTSLISFQRRPLLHAYALGLTSSSTMEYSPKMLPGSQIVLGVVRKIPAADLEQSVLMLPLPAIISFIKIIEEWINPFQPYLTSSCGAVLLGAKLIFLILSLHATQLVHCKELYPILHNIKKQGFSQLKYERNLIGRNLAMMKKLISYSDTKSKSNVFFEDTIFKKRSSLN